MTSFPPPSPHSSDAPYGQPGGTEPQWEPGAAYGSPGPAPGTTLPQGVPSQGGGPSPVASAPGTDLAADLGTSLKFAGKAMLRNPVAYLVSGLIYPVLIFGCAFVGMAAAIGFFGARADQLTDSDRAAVGLILLSIGLSFVAGVLAICISAPWQSGAARAAETIRSGGRPTIGQTLIGPGRVMVTALLVLVIFQIGSLLLYLPGLIASVLLFYAVPAAVRGASPREAMRISVRVVKGNLGTTIVAWLVLMVAATIGIGFVVGIIVAIPFMVLFQLGLFERLNGRTLPEPARS